MRYTKLNTVVFGVTLLIGGLVVLVAYNYTNPYVMVGAFGLGCIAWGVLLTAWGLSAPSGTLKMNLWSRKDKLKNIVYGAGFSIVGLMLLVSNNRFFISVGEGLIFGGVVSIIVALYSLIRKFPD